jgi:hypothetical protein
MVVQLVFAVWLGWLPVGGRFPPTLIPPAGSGFYLLESLRAGLGTGQWHQLLGTVRHLVLPAGTLGLLLSGIFANALRLNLTIAAHRLEEGANRSRLSTRCQENGKTTRKWTSKKWGSKQAPSKQGGKAFHCDPGLRMGPKEAISPMKGCNSTFGPPR